MEIIDENEKKKVLETKPPSLTMKVLRPLAHELAVYTDPSQIASIAKQFGFEKSAKNPDEVCAALLEMFETLIDEKNHEDLKLIIEALLALYSHLIAERLHEDGLIGSARKILHLGHYKLAFHIHKKEYLLMPYEGAVHGITMRVEGTTESDFRDNEKRKMRVIRPSAENGLILLTLTKDGALARQNPISGESPYVMEKGSRRHLVLRALLSDKSEKFCSTKNLAESVKCTESDFRRTCGEIRRQIKKRFSGLNANDVIDSKPRSGYRINPKTRIAEIP